MVDQDWDNSCQKNSHICELIKVSHEKGLIAWFFDLDGTLVRSTPGVHTEVEPDSKLQDILNDLHYQSGDATAVITGRPDVFVSGLMPERRFSSATEHGAIVCNDSESDLEVRCAPYDFTAVRRLIEARIALIEGCYIEDHKRTTLTIQFSEVADPDRLAPDLIELLQSIADSPEHNHPDDPLIVIAGNVKGNYVIDLVPRSADKAEAVKYFMAQNSFQGKVPVFCGDSAADESAMKLVKELGGYAIGVGDSAPACSDLHFKNIDEMRAYLTDIISLHKNHKTEHNQENHFR